MSLSFVRTYQNRCRLLGIVTALCLGGCAGSALQQPGSGQERDRAPNLNVAELRQLSQLPNPKVEQLKPSATGNGPQYVVWGKTYQVMPSAENYQEQGIASWYGVKFHGRRTSSGEPYDMFKLTAAHRSLPIPVFARVTNLSNGRSTIVRINDRGPFHEDRLIDLSYAAAVKLGFHENGTARVAVETLNEPQSATRLASADDVQDAKKGSIFLHAGRYETAAEARKASSELSLLGQLSVQIIAHSEGGFALRLGPISSDARRERLRALLIALDIGLPRLVRGR